MRSSSRDLRRALAAFCSLAVAMALAVTAPGLAGAHELDHPVPSFSQSAPLSSAANAGGEGAAWELVTTIPTGNPHTDIDFFTHKGDTYASVGTLAIGPNGGGQSIIRLTQDGEVSPSYVTGHPSASCVSNPSAATGLQHDVEATPRGEGILNNDSFTVGPFGDAQLLIDATDAEGRCHDQGSLGLSGAPQGGLELVDIADVTAPKEIGLTSHIGEAHTVHVDPKRPHIAYAISSDSVGVTVNDNETPDDPSDDRYVRANETEGSTSFALDGWEVVDMSSCMSPPYGTLPADADLAKKRELCRPEVYRYRYPTVEMALGHTNKGTMYACHEAEIYPNDLLTCGSGQAAMLFDISDAFEVDPATGLDKPRGAPLPCRVRPTSNAGISAAFTTGAQVVDCVTGGTTEEPIDLRVANWLKIGAPSLEGVQFLGAAYHQGRNATNQIPSAFPSSEDIDFNHEVELSLSGRFLLATDERGGGILPPGAACSPGVDNPEGNGGVHAYRVDRLFQETPDSSEVAFQSYGRNLAGEKAIYRATVRTEVEASTCTAHVMQQVPGQNRIFMGWYSQGTQVVDYVELPDGTIEFIETGYFIPEGANTWVSHVFSAEENDDGTWTYYGATGDFLVGDDGRSAIDIYKVTLPPPADVCDLAVTPEGYTDLDSSRDVHRPNVECAIHYKIAQGSGTGESKVYRPTEDVTREQMASFIVNTLEAAGAGEKLPAKGAGDRFTDIRSSAHRDSINRLAKAGIIQGTGGGKFTPRARITRAQMATFMVAAARFATGDEYAASSAEHFSDVGARNPHKGNINAGFEHDLFSGTKAPSGTEKGTFSPAQQVKRDQMASFLIRLFRQTIQ